jgi:hypothetical protein
MSINMIMTSNFRDTPVHNSLQVQAREDIYRTDEWWKSAVRYRFEDSDATEVAVYLWHNNGDGWTRKQKYVVKTAQAWAEDGERIKQFLSGQFSPTDETFPTSDYYTVTGGETVFHSDEWWKAIVNIGMKGDYETNEVMIYVWQQREGDWRRQQKSAIKNEDAWADLSRAVESVLEEPTTADKEPTEVQPRDTARTPDPASGESTEQPIADGEVTDLQEEIEAHLSATLK